MQPIGTSIEEYKEFLDNAVSGVDPKINWIENYENYSTDTRACFVILVQKKILDKLILEELPDEFGVTKIHKILKLTKNISLTNLVAYNSNYTLQKYDNCNEMIQEFYTMRLIFYSKRKDSLLKKYNYTKNILENKIRFITEQIDNILILYKKKKSAIISELENYAYMKISKSESSEPDYEYLLSMRMDSVTEEKLDKLKEELQNIINKINYIGSLSNKDMWNIELDTFVKEYNDYNSKLDKLDDLSDIKISTTLKTKIVKNNKPKPKSKTKPKPKDTIKQKK